MVEREQPWSSGLGTCLSTPGSCVRIPLRSRLEGSQCHPPPQGGTGCGEMDDISPSPMVGPALSRPGANKKKGEFERYANIFFSETALYLFHNDMLFCFVVIVEALFSNLSEKAHIKRVFHWLIG